MPLTLPFSVQMKAEERETKESKAVEILKKISQAFTGLSISESKALSCQEVIPGRGEDFIS